MAESLDKDQISRLWEHRLQADNEFYSRLNFFLVFESVLIGVVGVLFSKNNPPLSILEVIAIFGLIITILWSYIQMRHRYISSAINKRCQEIMPEYKVTIEVIDKAKWPLSSSWLMAYVIPNLVIVIWVVFVYLFFPL